MTERGPWELYVVPAAGGKAARLTEEGSDMNPDWRMTFKCAAIPYPLPKPMTKFQSRNPNE